MQMTKRLGAVAGWLVAALVILSLVRCSESPQEPEEVPVVEEMAVDPIEPQEVPEAEEEPITSEDVREELLDGFEEDWPEKAKNQTIDLSLQLFRFGEESGVDPIILADEYMDLLRATLDLQPAFRKNWDGGVPRAMLISIDLFRGAREVNAQSCHQIDERFPEDRNFTSLEEVIPPVNPYLLLSMGYRESSLARRVELGKKLGGRGERGMFQFLPQRDGRRGFIEGRFMPRFKNLSTRERCSPFDRMCATRGAANALAWIRCSCIELYGDRCTIDVFMAGYGMNKMPTPEYARHHRGAVNARRLLCKVRDDCDSLWPTDHDDDFALSL